MSTDIIHLEIRQLRQAHREFRSTCLTIADRMEGRVKGMIFKGRHDAVAVGVLADCMCDGTEIAKAGVLFADKVRDFLDRMDVLLAPERTTVIIDADHRRQA